MAATRLRLRVSPGAARSRVVGRHGDGWKVRVSAPPEDGRANQAVVRLLAETLDASRACVKLVSGHGGRDKIVEVAELEPADVDRRLESAARKERQ